MNETEPFKQKYALNFAIFCFFMWGYEVLKTYLSGNLEMISFLNMWLVAGIVSGIFTKLYFK
ncbi:MAG: hypothetical protein R3E32_12700 [Chitinophagales bacterium]